MGSILPVVDPARHFLDSGKPGAERVLPVHYQRCVERRAVVLRSETQAGRLQDPVPNSGRRGCRWRRAFGRRHGAKAHCSCHGHARRRRRRGECDVSSEELTTPRSGGGRGAEVAIASTRRELLKATADPGEGRGRLRFAATRCGASRKAIRQERLRFHSRRSSGSYSEKLCGRGTPRTPSWTHPFHPPSFKRWSPRRASLFASLPPG